MRHDVRKRCCSTRRVARRPRRDANHAARLRRIPKTKQPRCAARSSVGVYHTGAAGCGLAYYYEVEKTRRQEQAAKKQTTYGKPSLGRPLDANWHAHQTNKPVTDASFHGSYVLLYFGFSRCPDICPCLNY